MKLAGLQCVIITPARDEAQHITELIEGVLRQTVRPVEWVIVDDGSTDETGAIVDRYAAHHPWMTVIHRRDRGRRDADVGAVGAFVVGFRALRTRAWDFIVNLDADLGLQRDYLEKCFARFAEDPRLGIGGGMLVHHTEAGVEVTEGCPDFHVRGATKICRRACWDAIGGLTDEVPAWDTFLDVKALMAGWRVRTFVDIRALHRRPTGEATGGWHDCVKNGRSDYFLGYHPLFMLLKCTRRVFARPYVLNGAAHLFGFFEGYVRRLPMAEKSVAAYVRKQQLRRLLLLDSKWK